MELDSLADGGEDCMLFFIDWYWMIRLCEQNIDG